MSTAIPAGRMTYAAYVSFEEASEAKHEWVNGEVYAMAGGTPERARLAGEIIAALSPVLKAHGCRVYSSDLRVRITATGRGTYPDVTVVCGPSERDPEDALAVTNPTLLVEVLSEGTEASDRGDKCQHYRRMPSLRAYVLVDSRQERIEVFVRDGDGWRLSEAGPGQTLAIGLHDARLVVDELYRGREAS